MKTYTRPSSRGITLLEALIALLVISLGMLAIARFYGDIIASTGASKARVEALQIAETAIDELRARAMGQVECDAVGDLGTFPDPPVPVAGVNASFTPQTTVIPNITSTGFLVEVTVSWDDPKSADTSLVRLSSEIACDNPQTSVALVGNNSGADGLQASPTGRARLGGDNDYADGLPVDATDNTFPSGTDDGTVTHVTDGGTRELIDAASGAVVLTIDPIGDEATAPDFSTIAGRVYVEGNSPSPEVVRMLVSATGYCALNQPGDNSLPEGAEGSDIKYFFMEYQCYVGPEWYGNVGIYRIDGMATNDRVCVGDPDVEPSTLTTGRHPQLSVSRSYRGFEEVGVNADGDPTFTSVGIAAGQTYSEHDFLLVRITGSATDSDCTAQLQLTPVDATDTIVGLSEFVNNPGKMVCLTEGRTEPYECPDVWPAGSPSVTAQIITLSGTITTDATYSLSDTDLPTVFTGAGDNICVVSYVDVSSVTYTCDVEYIGEGWSGLVSIDPDWLNLLNLYASPSAHTLTAQFDDVSLPDFALSKDGPVIPTLKVSGTITRSLGEIGIASVSIERGTCDTLDWGSESLSTEYSCTSGEWEPGLDWLVSLAIEAPKDNVICAIQIDPVDISARDTDSTVTLRKLDTAEVRLDMNVSVKKNGEVGSTCPTFAP